MSRASDHVDVYEVLRAIDPCSGEPSSAESDAKLDAALRRLLTIAPASERGGLAPVPRIAVRRVALGGSVAVIVTVAAFAAANLSAGSSTPGAASNAWAKRLIEHVAAAVSGTGSGILHVVETETRSVTGADGPTTRPETIQSWDEQTAPHAFWATLQYGSKTVMTTVSGGMIEIYHSAIDTLYEIRGGSPRGQLLELRLNPAYLPVLALVNDQNSGVGQAPPVGVSFSQPQASEPLSALIAALLNVPDVRVNPDARINGESAVRIVGSFGYRSSNSPATNVHVTLYVEPKTYTPLKLVTTSNGGTAPATMKVTFTTYETLPAGSVSMPNLAHLYPNARVVSTTHGLSK